MNIFDIQHALAHDTKLSAALARIKPEVVNGVAKLLEETFRQIIKIEHANELALADQLHDAFWNTAAVAFHHFDSAGLNAALGAHAPLFEKFSFVENLPALIIDHALMVEGLGVPHDKAMHYWRHLDANRPNIVATLGATGFTFASLPAQGRKGFAGKGEPWQHMSPRVWVRIFGAVLAVANVGLAVGTALVGTPVAGASVAAGVGGIIAG